MKSRNFAIIIGNSESLINSLLTDLQFVLATFRLENGGGEGGGGGGEKAPPQEIKVKSS